MSKLAEYLKGRKEEEDALTADRSAIKEEWLRELDKLMTSIDEWLQPSVDIGLDLAKDTVTISEEKLGDYTAPKRIIKFAGTRVDIEPLARRIVGGYGRVDIRSVHRTVFLILSKPSDAWFIVEERDRTSRLPLNKDSFEGLMETFL